MAEPLTPLPVQPETIAHKDQASAAGEVSQAELGAVLDRVLSYSEQQNWQGYDKHDGLNCGLVRALFGWSRWSRLIAIQAMMRSPINLRPLLRQPKVSNPKGLALFVLGLLDRYAPEPAPQHLQRARSLIARLDELAVPVAGGARAWGYQYPWQDLGFYAPAGTPNAVVTAFVCEARSRRIAAWASRSCWRGSRRRSRSSSAACAVSRTSRTSSASATCRSICACACST